MGKPKLFSEQLREHVKASGLSWYRIGKELNIDKSILSKFANGINGLSQEKIDALCVLLDLELVKRGKATNKNTVNKRN